VTISTEQALTEGKERKKVKLSKEKKKKMKKKKKKAKAKVRLAELMRDDDDERGKHKQNALNVPKRSRVGERKSIIGMLRQGLIVHSDPDDGAATDDHSGHSKRAQNTGSDNDGNADGEGAGVIHEGHNIQVAVRVRPVNQKEVDIEHRLLFRTEFDMDDKEYDYFLQQRQLLMQQYSDNMDGFKALSVDAVCEWLDNIKLEGYKKRFRRRKVNGEWLHQFPAFNEKKPLEMEENAIIAFTKGNQSKRFKMDTVLKPSTTQNEAFEALGVPLIENIIRGYNCTVFAFGQTGTGKTHTMFGWHQEQEAEPEPEPEPETETETETESKEEEKEEGGFEEIVFSEIVLTKNKAPTKTFLINKEVDGLIPRIISDLFTQLNKDRDIRFFNISCGFIEIYQERLRDLIRPRLKIQLRYVGMGSELINLSWHDINCYNDMAKLIETSKRNRVTASTLQNETSSRSHCIIQVRIEVTLADGTNQCNKLSFGDLAGSEKVTKTGASGQRLSEAKKIVKSLFAIKKVIRALSEKKAFVPYQDSVLTKLLRDSLGGNSLTLIICTISPHAYNREETLSTLRFAEMAKKIKNEAIVNRMISRKEMETQINGLREQLQYFRKQKENQRRNRFTSTDFRLLQSQLMEASKKAEEYTQKYLQSEIQLLIKTQYIQELETLLNQKNIQIQYLKQQFHALKLAQLNIDEIDIDKYDVRPTEDGDDDDDPDADHYNDHDD